MLKQDSFFSFFKSPGHLTDLIVQGIDSFVNALERRIYSRTLWVIIFFEVASVLVIGLLYYILPHTVLDIDYLHEEQRSIFQFKYFYLVPQLILAIFVVDGVLRLFINNTSVRLTVCFFASFIFYAQLWSDHFPYLSSLLVALALCLSVLLHILILIATRQSNTSVRIGLFFLLEISMILSGYYIFRPWLQNSFMVLQLYRYAMIYSSVAVVDQQNSKGYYHQLGRHISYFLSPTHLISPLPVPSKEWHSLSNKTGYLKVKSLLFLIISWVFIILAGRLDQLRNSSYATDEYGFGTSLQIGFINYIFYFLVSYANVNIIVSLLWWFGKNIPNPYRLPLLAPNPQDRWRRWNTYFYDWSFRYIYFPVVKKVSSSFLGIVAVFLVMSFFHMSNVTDDYSVEFSEIQMSAGVSTIFIRKIVFFMLHALMVYGGIKFKNFFPNEYSKSAWWGVLAMLFLMSAVHAVFI